MLEAYTQCSGVQRRELSYPSGCRRLGELSVCSIDYYPLTVNSMGLLWQRGPERECVSKAISRGKSG